MSKNHPYAMLDIETLDTKETARVLSIAVVRFNDVGDYDENALYCHPSIKEQQNRTVSKKTMDFWEKQTPEAIAEAFKKENERCSIYEVYEDMSDFLKGATEVWANSPAFDLSIVRNLFGELNLSAPWNFWEERDVRTLTSMKANRVDWSVYQTGYPDHHPVGDCIRQVLAITPILNKMRTGV